MAYRRKAFLPPREPKFANRDVDGDWQHDLFAATERLIQAEQSQKNRENFRPAEVIVSNLDFNVSERDLYDLFSSIGNLQAVCIDFNRSGRSTGSATISFERKVDAMEAISQYNGRLLDNRVLHINLLNGSLGMTSTANAEPSRTRYNIRKECRRKQKSNEGQ